MKPIPLKLSVKSRFNRWFAYGCLALMAGIVGFFIARVGFQDHQQVFIIGGIALPFIFVIGEMIRFANYCSKIPAVMCVDCRLTFDIKQLCKTGKCPECKSKRVVGVKPDDYDQVFSLY